MSLAVWLGAVRKCSAAVVGLDLVLGLSMVRRCSLKRSFKRRFVSPMYCKLQRCLSWLMACLLPWVPEVFSRAQRDQLSAEGRTTSGEAARKTSGPERYDLPFPLNFDLFLSDLI